LAVADFIMILFLKLLFYKFFRVLEKYSIGGDEEHCAFHALLFSTLLLSFNLMVLFFAVISILDYDISNNNLAIGTLVYGVVLLIVSERAVLRSEKYKRINEEISNSKFQGRHGNIIIVFYIILTFLSMILLVLYFLYKNGII
jgi:hypothetical protein